jgi:cytochrome c oxidase cbb3-type subunit 3
MKDKISNKNITKYSLVTLFLAFAMTSQAADANSSFYSDLGLNLIGGAALIVIIAVLITLYKLLSLFIRMRELDIYQEHGIEKYLEEKKSNEGPWWKQFSRKLADVVPIEKEKDILLDHNYDGIRELDNNLPPWWLYGFYLSIAVSIFYIGFYHFSSYAKSSAEIYEMEMAAAKVQVDEFLSRQADVVDENNVELLTDEPSLSAGKSIFTTLCAVCHLEHGGGGALSVGPNLTDKYWIHGGSIKDVFTTIKYGVPEKGMISWKSQLRPADMHTVSSYILSLQGTNPPDAKEPQGDLYEPEDS